MSGGNRMEVMYGVFGRFDLAALCGCHTLNVCYVMSITVPLTMLHNATVCLVSSLGDLPTCILSHLAVV